MEQGEFKRKETKVAKARKELFFARLSVLRDFALNVQVIFAFALNVQVIFASILRLKRNSQCRSRRSTNLLLLFSQCLKPLVEELTGGVVAGGFVGGSKDDRDHTLFTLLGGGGERPAAFGVVAGLEAVAPRIGRFAHKCVAVGQHKLFFANR